MGEPILATATAANFIPDHPLTYEWTAAGTAIASRSNSATIDTTGLAPGSYQVTAHGTADTKQHPSASCAAQFSVKQIPRNVPTVSLSANPTAIIPGEAVTLTALCTSPDNVPVMVGNWTATSGNLSGTGNQATLDTIGVAPGAITISATCSDSRGLTASVSTEVSVGAPPPPPRSPVIVDTGRDFLLPGDLERLGYGLYSYLLWWDMPVQSDRVRFINIISAFMLMPKVSEQEGSEKVVNSAGQLTEPVSTIPRWNLNVAYIPINTNPTGTPTAEWILDHYDIARARILLAKLPRTYRSGPYIVSGELPLSHGLPPDGHYLFQNLSSRIVSLDLADAWVRQFQEQVQNQRPDEIRTFVLSLRAKVADFAIDVPQARAGLATWISWLSPPKK